MNPINYNNRRFCGRSNTPNGEVSTQTRFTYYQNDITLTGTYGGGSISQGHLLGTVKSDTSLEFVYHHLSIDGTFHAGICTSIPIYDQNGTLVLQEKWRWFTDDQSEGYSEIEEI